MKQVNRLNTEYLVFQTTSQIWAADTWRYFQSKLLLPAKGGASLTVLTTFHILFLLILGFFLWCPCFSWPAKDPHAKLSWRPNYRLWNSCIASSLPQYASLPTALVDQFSLVLHISSIFLIILVYTRHYQIHYSLFCLLLFLNWYYYSPTPIRKYCFHYLLCSLYHVVPFVSWGLLSAFLWLFCYFLHVLSSFIALSAKYYKIKKVTKEQKQTQFYIAYL